MQQIVNTSDVQLYVIFSACVK